jgi:hypothetical protein
VRTSSQRLSQICARRTNTKPTAWLLDSLQTQTRTGPTVGASVLSFERLLPESPQLEFNFNCFQQCTRTVKLERFWNKCRICTLTVGKNGIDYLNTSPFDGGPHFPTWRYNSSNCQIFAFDSNTGMTVSLQPSVGPFRGSPRRRSVKLTSHQI